MDFNKAYGWESTPMNLDYMGE